MISPMELARNCWWPHHESRTKTTALEALDAGDIGKVTMEFRDVLAIVRAAMGAEREMCAMLADEAAAEIDNVSPDGTSALIVERLAEAIRERK